MSPEIRRAALRAAAKTALIAALGCSGGQQSHPASNKSASEPAAASCKDHLAGLKTAKPEELRAGDPLRGRPGVYGAFADAVARSAPRTQQCCTEVLTSERTQSEDSAYRWPCCSALPAAPSGNPTACTPWGPPCPPEMT